MKIKGISYKVHPEFFNYLEKNRKQFQKNSNCQISQVTTTEMLARKMNRDITNIKTNSNKMNKPRRLRF